MAHEWLRYSRPLDGLRGVAVAMVVAFHASWLTGGWIGVDIFFVLSGYLITRLLLDEIHEHRWISLGKFWGRRARRLLPALLILVAAIAVADRFRTSPPSTAKWDIFGALTYSSNWIRVVLGKSYWDRFASPGLADHLWSLAIEEQFYLIWPVVMAVTIRRLRPLLRAIVLSLMSIAAGAYSIGMFVRTGNAGRVYLGTDTRVVALLAGAAVAGWAAAGLRLPARAQKVVATIAIAALAIAAVTFDGATVRVYKGGIVMVACATSLLLTSLLSPVGLVPRLLAIRPLVWLGRRSYGLYLWHWPIFVALHVAARPHSATSRRVVAIAIALVAAEISARFVELPIRHTVRRPSPKWLVRAGGLIGVATIAALLPVSTSPDRTEAKVLNSLPRPVQVNSGTTTIARPSTMAAASRPTTTTITPPASTDPNTPTRLPSTAATTGVTDPSPASPVGSASIPAEQPSAPATTAPAPTAPPKPSPPTRSGAPRILMVGDSVAHRLATAIARQPGSGGAVVDNRAHAGCLWSTRVVQTREGAGGVITAEPDVCATITRLFEADAQQVKPDAALVIFGAGFFHDNEIADGVWSDACGSSFHDYFRTEVNRTVTALGSAGATVYIATEAYYRAPDEPSYADLDAETDCKNAVLEEAARDMAGQFVLLRLGQTVCPAKDPCPNPDADIRNDGIHYDRAGATVAWDWLFPQMFPNG